MSRWQIDPAHSSAEFSVRHMMITTVRGRFSKLAGTVEYDPASPAQSKIDVTIDATSIDTREEQRDNHLRSPDFFDVEKFPHITFKSKRVEGGGDGLKVVGDLTMHGVTKEVVLHAETPTPPTKDPWGNLRIGAAATTKVNRKDFGLHWNKALEAGGVLVGEDVKISLDVSLVEQK